MRTKSNATPLDKNTWAIAWNKNKGYFLIAPDMKPNAVVPKDALALMGASVQLKNRGFRKNCAELMYDLMDE